MAETKQIGDPLQQHAPPPTKKLKTRWHFWNPIKIISSRCNGEKFIVLLKNLGPSLLKNRLIAIIRVRWNMTLVHNLNVAVHQI